MIRRCEWECNFDYIQIHIGEYRGQDKFDHLLTIENAIKPLPTRNKRQEVYMAKDYLEELREKDNSPSDVYISHQPKGIDTTKIRTYNQCTQRCHNLYSKL